MQTIHVQNVKSDRKTQVYISSHFWPAEVRSKYGKNLLITKINPKLSFHLPGGDGGGVGLVVVDSGQDLICEEGKRFRDE